MGIFSSFCLQDTNWQYLVYVTGSLEYIQYIHTNVAAKFNISEKVVLYLSQLLNFFCRLKAKSHVYLWCLIMKYLLEKNENSQNSSLGSLDTFHSCWSRSIFVKLLENRPERLSIWRYYFRIVIVVNEDEKG